MQGGGRPSNSVLLRPRQGPVGAGAASRATTQRVQAPAPYSQQHQQAHPPAFGWMSGGSSGGGGGGSSSSGGLYLASLNSYHVGWNVTARVFSKSDIRTYHNERGEGKIASLIFIDQSGSMKCVFFGEFVDKWIPILSEKRLYQISGAKVTSRRDSNYGVATTTEYDMICNAETNFIELPENSNVPDHSLRPVPIASLREHLEKQKAEEAQCKMMNQSVPQHLIDVIGIIIESGPQMQITTKTGAPLLKRDLVLMDESGAAVKFTIWGDKFALAEVDLQASTRVSCNILAVGGARLGDFAECSISTSFSANVVANPQWPEVIHLREWYNRTGGSGFLSQLPWSNIAFLHQLKSQLGQSEQASLKVSARIAFIKHDPSRPPWYPACPTQMCKFKKVQKMDEGTGFYCDRCNETSAMPVYRYILSLVIQDETGSQWVTCFDREGEQLLGVPASQFAQEMDESRLTQAIQQANNKDYVLGISCQQRAEQIGSQYENSGPRFQVFACRPLDHVKDTAEMLEFIARANLKLESGGANSSSAMQM